MADKKLAGARVLMVIAPEQFRDEELLEPKQILESAGATVTVASTQAGEAEGMLGARVKPETTIDQIDSADFQAVVVVGGMGSPTHLWNNGILHHLLKDCAQAGKVVGGICLSGAVLANAGVLSGKKGTVWATPESLQALEAGNCKYVKDHVVHDGNVVTADGPEAATTFGNTLVHAMQQSGAKV